ncbi:MAG: GNAT family N-acetyltransferase [Frankiales bacterium]|nr:GNAT family N-acetyltransferase [Frankiales bacterium]
MPRDDAVVTLREVTDENRADVEALSVTPEQAHYVAPNTQSFQDALETPEACPWFRAVYADDTPVGFVMISDGVPESDDELLGPYYLWRLMIDTRWQRRGYGTAALDLVVEHVRGRPGARRLLSSIVPGEVASPREFYLRYGFRLTGEWHDGEEVTELLL